MDEKFKDLIAKAAEVYKLECQGKSAQAGPLGTELETELKKLAEPEFQSLVGMLSGVGVKLGQAGNNQYAGVYFEIALCIAELMGQDSPEIRKNAATAHNNYAISLSDLGRNKESEEHYQKALELKPDDAEAHNNYAILLSKLDRNKPAEEHYQKALELKPDHAGAHNNYAIVLSKLGRNKPAEEHYQKALELKPDHAEAHNNYAILLSKLKRGESAEKEYEKAIENCQKALEKEPDNERLKRNLSSFRLNSGLYFCGLSNFERALEVVVESADPAKSLLEGAIYFELSRLPEAKEKLGGYLAIDGAGIEQSKIKRQIGFVFLGRTCLALKHYQEADGNFNKALELFPDEPRTFLWKIYGQYLSAEFEQRHSLPEKEREMIHKQNLNHLISRLDEYKEKLEQFILTEKAKYKNQYKWYSRAVRRIFPWRGSRIHDLQLALSCLHHFQATLYCKLGDHGAGCFHARMAISSHPRLRHSWVRLFRRLKNDKEFNCLYGLLYHIWNFRVRPPFWRWWLASPVELGVLAKWSKRTIFAAISFYLFLVLAAATMVTRLGIQKMNIWSNIGVSQYFEAVLKLPGFLGHWIETIAQQSGSNPRLIILGLVIAGCILAAPQIAKIRAGGYEMELTMPEPFEMSAIQLESILKRT